MSVNHLIAELTPKIGAETHVSPWLTVTQERINQFAAATEDFQWIHTDEKRAAQASPYGSTIAHGFLSLSLIPYLTGSVNPEKPRYPGVKMGINYGLNRVRFPHPVKVGAKVRTRTTLLSVEAVKESVQIISQVTIEIDGEPKPGCVRRLLLDYIFRHLKNLWRKSLL